MLNQPHHHHTNYAANTLYCLQWTFLRPNHNIKLRVYSRSSQVSIKFFIYLERRMLIHCVTPKDMVPPLFSSLNIVR